MNGLTIIVLLFLLGVTAIGYSKGLLRTVYSILSGIIILVLVTVATPYIADALADYTTLDTKIENMCHEQLRNAINKNESEKNLEEKKDSNTKKVVDKKASGKKDKKSSGKSSGKANGEKDILDLESFENIGKLQIRLPDVLLEYLMDTDQYADELLEKSGIYESVSKRITRMALNAIAFLITFIILTIVFGVIYRMFHIIEKLPVIGEANKGLGAILGFVKGMVIVWIFFAFVSLNAVSEFGQQFIAMVYESPILIFIYENNYVLVLLMKFFGKI